MASSHAAKAASVLSRPTKTVVMSLVVNRACIEPSASAHTRTTSESASVPTAFDLGGFKNDARGWELLGRRLSSSRTAGLRRPDGASPRATPHRLQQYREERRRGEYSGPRLSNTRPDRPDNGLFERAFGTGSAPRREVRGITPPWRDARGTAGVYRRCCRRSALLTTSSVVGSVRVPCRGFGARKAFLSRPTRPPRLAGAWWRYCEALARVQRDGFEEVEHEVGVLAFGVVGL